jgi:uncharacterized protein (DUF1810 family)
MSRLGRRRTAQRYGICDLDERYVCLLHPILRVNYDRLVEVVWVKRVQSKREAVNGFAPIDTPKLMSSLALFAWAERAIQFKGNGTPFAQRFSTLSQAMGDAYTH